MLSLCEKYLTLQPYRCLGAKGSYLTLVRVADRILLLRGYDMVIIFQVNIIILSSCQYCFLHYISSPMPNERTLSCNHLLIITLRYNLQLNNIIL